MKATKSFFLRLLITTSPLLALYLYAQIAFEANRQREHRTDTGLGVAFLLIFILLVLFVGFAFDLSKKAKIKNRKIVLIDIFFLLLLTTPLLYFGCLMFSNGCFCDWITNLIWMMNSNFSSRISMIKLNNFSTIINLTLITKWL